MSRKPIICVDFDGVIHSYTSGWKGAHRVDDPIMPGVVAVLLSYLDAGFDVAIYSSRSKNIFGRWAMQRYLARSIADHWREGHTPPSLVEAECWGDAAGIWMKFKWPWFKPAALMTIDDRAFCFAGIFPTVEEIRAFKPWKLT